MFRQLQQQPSYSQMAEQSAGQPYAHMSFNKGASATPPLVHDALELCFGNACATDCLLSTGNDKTVLPALLWVIYFWAACYLLVPLFALCPKISF